MKEKRHKMKEGTRRRPLPMDRADNESIRYDNRHNVLLILFNLSASSGGLPTFFASARYVKLVTQSNNRSPRWRHTGQTLCANGPVRSATTGSIRCGCCNRLSDAKILLPVNERRARFYHSTRIMGQNKKKKNTRSARRSCTKKAKRRRKKTQVCHSGASAFRPELHLQAEECGARTKPLND